MKNKIKWYQDKISEHQAIELAAVKVGNDELATKAKQSIEHYQELLNSQK